MIAVIGDLMMDVLVLSELRDEEQETGLLLRPGGSAANTASWLARSGSNVFFVGCVGSDATGEILAADLIRRGITPSLKVVPGVDSGAVVVEITNSGERVMRSARGANVHLSVDQIQAAQQTNPTWVHLTGYSLLCADGPDLLRAAGDVAQSCNAILSFDPSSLGVIDRIGREPLLALFDETHVDILLPNRDEAEALTACTTTEAAAQVLLEAVPHVAISDGAKPSLWGNRSRRGWAAPRASKVFDSTGAGDAFDAGIIHVLSSGGTLDTGCEVGHSLAGEAIRLWGGRPDLVESPR